MSQAIADIMRYADKIAHTEDGWIQPLVEVVQDVDAETARWKPSPDVASIWEILEHAMPYLEGRICDFTGDPYPDVPDWPEVSDTAPEAWSAMQARVESASKRMAEQLAKTNDDHLATPVPNRDQPRVVRLMDIFIHDAYHAGQILKLTQIYRAQIQ